MFRRLVGSFLPSVSTVLADGVCSAKNGRDCKMSSLPEGWDRQQDWNGQEFFFHAETGTAQWERPTGPVITAAHSLRSYLDELETLEVQTDLNASQTRRLTTLKGVKALSTMEQDSLPTPQDMQWRVLSSGADGKTPRIYLLDNFLTAEECEYLIAISSRRLTPARVVQNSGNKFDAQTSIRNNEQIWLTSKEEREDPVLRHIVKRMHRSAHVPEGDAEALQVGRYHAGTKYEMHADSTPAGDVSRPATIIVYLNDVEAGGETIFPVTKANHKKCAGWHGEHYGIANCCDVSSPAGGDPGLLRIHPKRGQAMLFFNHNLNGKLDPSAEHAACPPKSGSEKWIVQRWFRYIPHVGVTQPHDMRFDGFPKIKPAHVANGVWLGRNDARVLNQKQPSIYLFEHFLNDAEHRHLQGLAENLGIMRNATPGTLARYRLTAGEEAQDDIISAVLRRMHSFARVPDGFADSLELVAYGVNASLALHTDSNPKNGTSRPLSMIVYLSGGGLTDDGGATFFPMGACSGVDDCCDRIVLPSQLFAFRLDGGKKLGLKLAKNKEDHLIVRAIQPGVVKKWNDANTQKQLVVGSRITEVNGIQGASSDLTTAIKNAHRSGLIRLRVHVEPSVSREKPRQQLLVPPKLKDALLFLSHSLDGKLHEYAKHGSCPAGPQGKLVLQRVFRARRNPSLKQ